MSTRRPHYITHYTLHYTLHYITLYYITQVEPQTFMSVHALERVLIDALGRDARGGVRALAVVCDGHLIWNGLPRYRPSSGRAAARVTYGVRV